MSDEQTLTYDEGVETVSTEDNLTAEEQDSLKIGEQMEEAEDQLLAGKYKNAEELEKAHIELQKKLGENSPESSEEEEVETEEEVEEVEVSGNLLDQLWNEGTNDKLSKETFEQIQQMDPVEVAKMAMQQRSQMQNAGPQEFSDNDIDQIQGLVGGEDNYNNLVDWAGDNLPDQEVQLYDAVMNQGNPLAAYFAVQALALKYQDASGRDGEMVTGKAPKASGDVFNSQAELIRAMEDDRYTDDPAYREAVTKKLERSKINF
jgi:hypothetical protein